MKMTFNKLTAKKRPGLEVENQGISHKRDKIVHHKPGMAPMSKNNGVQSKPDHLVLDAVKFPVSITKFGVSKSFEHIWFTERRLDRSGLNLYLQCPLG